VRETSGHGLLEFAIDGDAAVCHLRTVPLAVIDILMRSHQGGMAQAEAGVLRAMTRVVLAF
jgi:hypothetical protein